MMRKWTTWLVLVSAAACGGGTTENDNGNPQYPGDPGGSPAQTATVDILDNRYSPNSLVVAVGGTVTFHWIGNAGHSVTPTGSPAFSPTAGISYPPKDLAVTFTTAGTYHYHCILHGVSDGYGTQGNMIGTIVVR